MKKLEIDMDATNEIFRRMDAIEKRTAEYRKEVRALKEEIKDLKDQLSKPTVTRKSPTSKKTKS